MLELLIAVVMVAAAVAVTSLMFPKAAKSLTNNRQRWLAANFAQSRMQELKSLPYGLLPLTDPAVGTPFPVSGTGDPGCNCEVETLAGVATDATYTEDGVVFVRKVCTNLTEGAVGALTHCPDNPLTTARDKGLKSIRIVVTWASGNQTYSTEMENLVAR